MRVPHLQRTSGRLFRPRRGKALLMLALMLPALCGAMALAIDTGVIGTARAQLRTVADAAALAGAMQLVSPAAMQKRLAGSTNLTNEITLAQQKALAIGTSNVVLRDKAVLLSGGGASGSTGDVAVGYIKFTDGKPEPSSFTTDSSKAADFNSVRVWARKSSTHGGLIPNPFGALLGSGGVESTLRSTASVRNLQVQGFKRNPTANVNFLPIVLDKYNYDRMIGRVVDSAAPPSDQYTYNPTTKTVTNGPDGVKESLLYGQKKPIPGNWGTVKVGVNNNSTSTLGAQIRYGITPQQMANMGGSIQLDPVTKTLILEGNPGLSAGIKDDLEAIIGKPVTIPIYDKFGGNGNNAWYEIVDFAGVRIVKVDLTGNNKHVIVQPAYVDEPMVIVNPRTEVSFTQGGAIRLHLSE